MMDKYINSVGTMMNHGGMEDEFTQVVKYVHTVPLDPKYNFLVWNMVSALTHEKKLQLNGILTQYQIELQVDEKNNLLRVISPSEELLVYMGLTTIAVLINGKAINLSVDNYKLDWQVKHPMITVCNLNKLELRKSRMLYIYEMPIYIRQHDKIDKVIKDWWDLSTEFSIQYGSSDNVKVLTLILERTKYKDEIKRLINWLQVNDRKKDFEFDLNDGNVVIVKNKVILFDPMVNFKAIGTALPNYTPKKWKTWLELLHKKKQVDKCLEGISNGN